MYTPNVSILGHEVMFVYIDTSYSACSTAYYFRLTYLANSIFSKPSTDGKVNKIVIQFSRMFRKGNTLLVQ